MVEPIRTTARKGVAVSLVGSLALAGCASAIDPNDICGRDRAALSDTENYYVQAVVTGGLIGAVVGGLAGASMSDNKGAGALIGATAGGVAGGLAGYYMAKQKESSDRAALLSSIQNDIEVENAQVDRATTAFLRLRECRFTAARRIKLDYAEKRLVREDAVRRLDEQRYKFGEDLAIAERVGAKMTEKSKQFQYASDELVKDDPVAARHVAARQQAQAAQSAAPTHAKKAPARQPPAPSAAPVQPVQRANAPVTTIAVTDSTESNQVKQTGFNNTIAQDKEHLAHNSAFQLDGSLGRFLDEFDGNRLGQAGAACTAG